MKNLIFLSLLLFTASCSKSDLDVKVKGEIFQCCNLWEDFVTTDNTNQDAVSDFLSDNNIAFTDFQIIENGPTSVCATCCQCPDGKEVSFKVNEEDLAAVLALGFEEN